MPDQLQLRGGTTAEHSTFTGAIKEVTVDTSKKTVVVHDGTTAGGIALLRQDGSNSALTLGSAGTPSIKFTGDTNTGIYSPGADQVAVATNGTEKLIVLSNGNVGIGTNSPLTKLDVRSGAITAGTAEGTNGPELLRGYYSGGGALAVIGGECGSGGIVIGCGVKPSTVVDSAFFSSTGITLARGAYTIAGNVHKWYIGASQTVAENSSVSTSEVMRIDSSGRLLVGTSSTSQAATLLIQGNSSIGATGAGILKLARGEATPTSGFTIGELRFTDSGHTSAATIDCRRDGGTWTSGSSQPTRLTFSTTADGASSPTEAMRISANGNVNVVGALSKGSGSFRIDHPLSEKKDTHHLIHSFIEGPQADLIYRGHVNLINGKAIINIDDAARMAEGTFNALCTNVCCFTSNESDWTAVRGSVSDNILTIEAQDLTSTAEVCWMVIGERKDQHMLDTNWTDENGRVITEPLKEVTPSVTP